MPIDSIITTLIEHQDKILELSKHVAMQVGVKISADSIASSIKNLFSKKGNVTVDDLVTEITEQINSQTDDKISKEQVEQAINSYHYNQANQQNNSNGTQNNVQGTQIIFTGVSVSDVIDISKTQAENVFYKLWQDNAPKLQKEAIEEMDRRVLEFQKDFFSKASKELNVEDLEKFSDPDVQFISNEAIKSVARRDVKELNDLLSDLLISRLKNDNEDLKKLVLNEAITTINKLTVNQLKIISLIFLVKYVKYNDIDTLEKLENNYVYIALPLLDFRETAAEFGHIQFSGCGTRSIVYNSFEDILLKGYGELFQSLSKEQVINLIKEQANIYKVFEVWNNSAIRSFSLTSVGQAIAISYIKQVTVAKFNFDVWIN